MTNNEPEEQAPERADYFLVKSRDQKSDAFTLTAFTQEENAHGFAYDWTHGDKSKPTSEAHVIPIYTHADLASSSVTTPRWENAVDSAVQPIAACSYCATEEAWLKNSVAAGSGEGGEDKQLYGELYLDHNGEAHFICHTKDADFARTRQAFFKFIGLLVRQIVNQEDCPFAMPSVEETSYNENLADALNLTCMELDTARSQGFTAGYERAREDAAKAMCEYCRHPEQFAPPALIEGSTRLWHQPLDGDDKFTNLPCGAAAIRALTAVPSKGDGDSVAAKWANTLENLTQKENTK